MQFKIPRNVQKWAHFGNYLKTKGYHGGTATGIKRGRQLANRQHISYDDFVTMRNWFAAHGPGAKNGGTSFQRGHKNGNSVGRFFNWYKNRNKKRASSKSYLSKHKGFVAWCLWGGNAGFVWIQNLAKRHKLKLNGTIPKSKISLRSLKGGVQSSHQVIQQILDEKTQIIAGMRDEKNRNQLLFVLLKAIKSCPTKYFEEKKAEIQDILSHCYYNKEVLEHNTRIKQEIKS